MSDNFPPFDETVGDDAPHGFPGREIAAQRVYHGLLRAMHTMDAESREARIQGIVDQLPPARAQVWSWPRLAAAAAFVATIGLTGWFVQNGEQQLQATLGKAGNFIRTEQDREFRFENYASEFGTVYERRGAHRLILRPGGRFEVRCNGKLGTCRIGGNPSEPKPLWIDTFESVEQRALITSFADELARLLGDPEGGLFDIGFVNIERIVSRLPGSEKLRQVPDPELDEGKVRIEGNELVKVLFGGLHAVRVIIDEETGAILELMLEETSSLGLHKTKLLFEYVRDVSPDPERYKPRDDAIFIAR